MRKILLSLAVCALLGACCNEHPDRLKDYEKARFEVTYELTQKKDTVTLEIPKDAVIIKMHGPYYSSRTIYNFYSDDNLAPIYIDGLTYWGLEGLGNIKRIDK